MKYKMIGCNKRVRTKKHKRSKKQKKRQRGGLNLAYTGNKIQSISNPFLGYVGKGGCNRKLSYKKRGGCGGASTCSLTGGGYNSNDGFPTPPENANNISVSKSASVYPGSAPYLITGGGNMDINKAYPSTVGTPAVQNWLNSQNKKGGSGCGCNSISSLFSMKGGSNYGNLVPNGTLGEPWTSSIKTWPGVDGISMNRNYFPLNTYENDVSRQMLNIGANYPYNIKGGSRKIKKYKHSKKKYYQKGKGTDNHLGMDFINLGRKIDYNLQSQYNQLNAIPSPVNPLPWKDQLK